MTVSNVVMINRIVILNDEPLKSQKNVNSMKGFRIVPPIEFQSAYPGNWTQKEQQEISIQRITSKIGYRNEGRRANLSISSARGKTASRTEVFPITRSLCGVEELMDWDRVRTDDSSF
jgi:hypothetical protein